MSQPLQKMEEMIQYYYITDLGSQNPFSWMSNKIVCIHLKNILCLISMVRKYEKKRVVQYSKGDVMEAVQAVKEKKIKISVAATQFGIPQSTLYDHVKGSSSKIGAGAPTILSRTEEKEIVVPLQVLQEMGFRLTKELAGIKDYLHDQPLRPNPFKDGIPGKYWRQLFLSCLKKLASVNHNTYHLTEHFLQPLKLLMTGLKKLGSCFVIWISRYGG